jgi:hypothetical protein
MNIQTEQCSFGYGGTRQKSIFTTLGFVVTFRHPQGPVTRQIDQGFAWFFLVVESLVFKFQIALHAFLAAPHINFKISAHVQTFQNFQNFMLLQFSKYIK